MNLDEGRARCVVEPELLVDVLADGDDASSGRDKFHAEVEDEGVLAVGGEWYVRCGFRRMDDMSGSFFSSS